MDWETLYLENEILEVDQTVGGKLGLCLQTPTQPQSTGTTEVFWPILNLILYKSVAIRSNSSELNGIIDINRDEITFMFLYN